MGILDQWSQNASSVLQSRTAQRQGLDASQGTTDPMLISSNSKYLVVITQDQDIQTISKNGPVIVVGQVPESLQMNQTATYRAPWGAGLAGDGNVSDLLAVTMGNRLVAQVLTLQVWQGAGNDVDFTVQFEFRAWSDVDRDVMQPLRSLSAMALPSVDPSSGFLRSPGPLLDSDAVKQIGGNIVQGAVDITNQTKNAATSAMTDGGSKIANFAVATVAGVSGAIKAAGQKLATAKTELEALMKNKISITIGDFFYMNNVVITDVQHDMKTQRPGPNGGLMAANVSVTFRPVFALTADDMASLLQFTTNNTTASGTGGSF